MRHITITLLLLLLSKNLSAIDIFQISNITDRNGLSQNTVRCIMQDSKGFLWMGTINGLNRYNGKEFMPIQPQADFSTSLPDSRIRSIKEDKNGHIWIRTFSNTLLCYDPRLERFIDYEPENKSKKYSNLLFTSNGDVWLWGNDGYCCLQYKDGPLKASVSSSVNKETPISFIFEDSKYRIWIGSKDKLLLATNNGVLEAKDDNYFNVHEYMDQLFFISKKNIAVYDIQKSAFLSDIPINIYNKTVSYNRSCMLNDGIIMIADNKGLYALDTKKKEIKSARSFFKGEDLPDANFHIDNKGHIWVYNMTGTLWRHNQDNTFEPLKLIPSNRLSLITQERYQVYEDSRNIIWITTFGNGLFAIDQNNENKVYHYTTGKELPTDYLFCITEDNSGEIWIGTEFSGVTKISLSNYPFEVFYPTSKEPTDRGNATRMIYQDKNDHYWFGTRDGNVHVYNTLLQRIHTYQVKDGLPFSMAEDTLGNKWIGTKGGGVLVFPPDGGFQPKIHHLHSYSGQSSSSNNIFSIMRDSKGRMWIASFGGGLHLAEYKDNMLTSRQLYLQKTQQNMMRSMIQDHTGLIWVGSNEGVIVFDPEKILKDEKNYICLYPDTKSQQLLTSNEVRVVFEDSKKRLWIGCTGGGLNLLVRKSPLTESTFKHYDAKNGLANEMIQAIQEDNDGYIWISTESGISKFNPKTERFENFTVSNNGRAAIFNELSSWKKKNGELMFGSYNGVYIFNPSEVTYDTYAPQVVITELKINGNTAKPGEKDSPLEESITNSKKITLKHDQNSFNLEYTMLNLQAPEFNQYMYYLEGYEEGWNPISRNNTAAYRNVPPGKYLFKVKGCNSFGIWNDQETTIEIQVLPPWWKSDWAIFSYLIISILAIYFVSRLIIRMNRLRMAVEVEKQLTEYKLQFFTNISHEFRTPLTIIRGAIENLTNIKDLSPSANEQLSVLTKSSIRLLRLVDQLLEFRRLQKSKSDLKLERTNPNNFFYDIFITFKEMADNKRIHFEFRGTEDEYLLLMDRSKMDKVAYNLLSNAFKHTPDGGIIEMNLQASIEKDCLQLSVSDSGKGIPNERRDELFIRFKQLDKSAGGTGIGLHLTSELLKLHHGNITYQDTKLGGASFLVTIPLSDKHYNAEEIISNNTESTAEARLKDYNEVENVELSIIDESEKKYKVMIVEDDDEIRNFIEKQLNQYFFTLTATNGSEALKQIADEQPDIVVCDVMMPKMDGFEFTKRLKGTFDTSHIPVILLTAYSSEEHKLEGIQSGADAYVTKPFSTQYLLARITKLLESRERLRRKFNTEPGLVQSSITFNDRDQVFLDKLHEMIEGNIDNIDFKIEDFAQTLNMSRTTFYRKMKGITGYAPNEYVRIIRMKKAAELLMNTDMNVSEISYKVGISDPFYLSKCFKAQFGKSPSQYRKKED